MIVMSLNWYENGITIWDGKQSVKFPLDQKIYPIEDIKQMLRKKEDCSLLLAMVSSIYKIEFRAPTLDEILDQHILRLEYQEVMDSIPDQTKLGPRPLLPEEML